jgi:hypothetical protein
MIDETKELITSVRKNELELPSEVSVTYANIDNDYQSGTEYARRLTATHENKVVINLPLALTSTEAAKIADIALSSAWYSGRYSYSFSTTYAHLKLSPGDLITIPLNTGRNELVKIISIEYGPTGLINYEAVPEIPSLYTSVVSGDNTVYVPQIVTGISGPTTLIMIDSCMLRDTDTYLSWYVGLSSTYTGWRGGALYKSNDAGATWGKVTSASKDGATKYGITTTLLGSADARVWDKANTLTIRMYTGTLSSATETSVLDGANAALVGAHGRWELIQYQIAVQNSDGTWTISNLLRGRRGTESAIALHTIGDTIVLLSEATISACKMTEAELNADRVYKAVTIGEAIESIDEETHNYTGQKLKPLAPVDFTAQTQPNGDIILKWKRRDRIARPWNTSNSLAMSETTQAYKIDVVVDSTVVQTLNATSESLIYYNLDQTEFEAGSVVTFNLYQMSTTVGRGHVVSTYCTSNQTAIFSPFVPSPDPDTVVFDDDITPRYLLDDGIKYLSIAGNEKVYTSTVPSIDTYKSTLPIPFNMVFGSEDSSRVAYLSGKYVLANSDKIVVTTDFINWTTSTMSTSDYTYMPNHIIADSAQFISTDSYGKIYTSTNGSTWVYKYMAPVGIRISSIATDKAGNYIMVGIDKRTLPYKPYVATSTNLTAWTDRIPTLTTYMGATISVIAPSTLTWTLGPSIWDGTRWIIGGKITMYISSEDSYRFYPLVLLYNGVTTYTEVSPYVGMIDTNNGKTVESICIVNGRVQIIGFKLLMSQPIASPPTTGNWQPANLLSDPNVSGSRFSLGGYSTNRIIVYSNNTKRHYLSDGSTIWS